MYNVVWLYGLSGAGKSTIAGYLSEQYAFRKVVVLDGDEARRGLCRGLGFSDEDRLENHRRVASVAAILQRQGFMPVVAMMTPNEGCHAVVNEELDGRVIRVYVAASQEECVRRDPKGLYAKLGEDAMVSCIRGKHYPHLIIKTEGRKIQECVNQLFKELP